MQTIVPGSENITKLITSLVKRDMPFKRSIFLLECRSDDGRLLCNTLTGEVVLLTQEEENFICQDSFGNSLLREDFIRHGFLVPVNCDEIKRTEQLQSIFRKQQESENRIIHYNILPTTDCNARCFYCYQNGIKHVTMTKEVADQLITFISNHRGESDTVILSWFGGEPTLGKQRIDYICEGLKALNIPYFSNMVSNGYLFDEKGVQQAKDLWHLRSIQITLDGTEAVYNEVKSFVSVKESPYRKVLKNIKLFIDEGIHVDIRLNMDEHNADDLLELVTELENLFSGKQNLIVYVRLLKENVGCKPVVHEGNDKIILRKRYMQLRDRLEKAGWPQTKMYMIPKLTVNHCMADNPGIVQCTPDGILGKCEDSIYEHTVGTLKEGIINKYEVERWKQKSYFEPCYSCPLVPSCLQLLKNCPPRANECLVDEKDNLLEKITEVMLSAYAQWKTTQNESKQSRTELSNQKGMESRDEISTSVSRENC